MYIVDGDRMPLLIEMVLEQVLHKLHVRGHQNGFTVVSQRERERTKKAFRIPL